MVKGSWWCAILSVLLFVVGAGSVRAVEYGEMVQKNGKWEFRSTEDPVLKLMLTKGLITNERYFEVSAQKEKTGSNPPMRSSIYGRETRMDPICENRDCIYPIGSTWASKTGRDLKGMIIPGDPPKQVEAGKPIPRWSSDPELRVGLGNGPFRFLFEGQDSRAYWNDAPGDFVNTTTVNEWDILQLFGSLTMNNVAGSGLRTDLHFGRMTLDFGMRRYVARNDFRNTTNAFDGVHWQISEGKTWRFRAFLVEPVIRDMVQLDEQSANSVFWGTYVESQHIPWLNANVFYFGLNDQRPQNGNLQRTYSTYGLRLFKSPAINEFDYEFEGAIQTGRLGNVDHFAYNPNAEAGYTFNLPWTPRFLAQYTYSSGTRTPGGSQDGNFDILFGARNFDLMPTGNFGPFFRSNISSPGWRLIVRPAPNLTVQVKQRFWYLAEARGVYSGGLLQDSTGGAGNYLGHDLQLRVQWAVSQNLDFDAGYDHWFKGSYFDSPAIIAQMPAGGNKDTDYFYFQMRVRL